MNKAEMDLRSLRTSFTEIKERLKEAERQVVRRDKMIKRLLEAVSEREETIAALQQSQLQKIEAENPVPIKTRLELAMEAIDRGSSPEDILRLLEDTESFERGSR